MSVTSVWFHTLYVFTHKIHAVHEYTVNMPNWEGVCQSELAALHRRTEHLGDLYFSQGHFVSAKSQYPSIQSNLKIWSATGDAWTPLQTGKQDVVHIDVTFAFYYSLNMHTNSNLQECTCIWMLSWGNLVYSPAAIVAHAQAMGTFITEETNICKEVITWLPGGK